MESFKEDIKNAINVLRKGGVILYPTDTVWGLGCDATSSEAVKRIYEIKKRSDEKAMLLLTDCMARLNFYVEEIPDIVYDLIECAERPLTIIYDKGKNLAPELLARDGSIGIRITREKFSNALCAGLGKALVSTSANISGEVTPRFFNEISKEIKDSVDYIAEYRREDLTPSQPSTLMKVGRGGIFKIIRP